MTSIYAAMSSRRPIFVVASEGLIGSEAVFAVLGQSLLFLFTIGLVSTQVLDELSSGVTSSQYWPAVQYTEPHLGPFYCGVLLALRKLHNLLLARS